MTIRELFETYGQWTLEKIEIAYDSWNCLDHHNQKLTGF